MHHPPTHTAGAPSHRWNRPDHPLSPALGTAHRGLVAAAIGLTALALLAAPGRAANEMPNGSFGNGLTGWTAAGTGGSISPVPSYSGDGGGYYQAVDDTPFAVLIGGYQDAFTTLASPTFHANPGDRISGWSFFQANDSASYDYDDEGDVRVVALNGTSTAATLFHADILSVGDYGGTPWTHWEYTFPASGDYRLEARVVNHGDSYYSSALGLDNVVLTLLNRPPLPQPDVVTIDEDTAYAPPAPGALANDADPDGDPLTASLVSGPDKGTLALSPDGTFTFTPAPNAYGMPYTTFTYEVSDGRGGTATSTVTINVNPVNDAPAVSAGAAAVSVDEEQTATISGAWGDIDSADVTLSASAGAVIRNADGTWTWSSATVDGPKDGQTVTITADDGSLQSSASFTLTVNNVAPTVSAPADQAADEGEAKAFDLGAFADPGSDAPWTVSVDWGDGTTPDVTAATPGPLGTMEHTYADNRTYTATVTVTDKDGASGAASFAVKVANVAPTAAITEPASGALSPVNTYVHFAGQASDPGTQDTLSARWSFTSADQALDLAGTVAPDARTVAGDYAFTLPGVYTVTLDVTDKDAATAETHLVDGLPAYVVVYDPSGPFVTGGGWVNSPAGAYRPDASLSGRATFGFVARTKKGATVPDGNTAFQFQAAGLSFKSVAYEWLVVAGARAQYKGTGTLNGTGDYGFLLTAIDGRVNGGTDPDRFRIKVWDNASGAIVYDNQNGSDDNAALADSTVLGGGSIVIHTK